LRDYACVDHAQPATSTYVTDNFVVFTARRNARIASAVLAIAIPPSVCLSVRLSVLLSHAVSRVHCSAGLLIISRSELGS